MLWIGLKDGEGVILNATLMEAQVRREWDGITYLSLELIMLDDGQKTVQALQTLGKGGENGT